MINTPSLHAIENALHEKPGMNCDEIVEAVSMSPFIVLPTLMTMIETDRVIAEERTYRLNQEFYSTDQAA